MIIAIILTLLVCIALAIWSYNPNHATRSDIYAPFYAGIFTCLGVLLLIALFIAITK